MQNLWVLRGMARPSQVLDPFCGSGTVLIDSRHSLRCGPGEVVGGFGIACYATLGSCCRNVMLCVIFVGCHVGKKHGHGAASSRSVTVNCFAAGRISA